MRILIADDEATSRFALESVLKQWGFEVIACQDGHAAKLELEKPDSPNIAILDWLMPGLSGVDVCRALRVNPSTTPPYLILLTSLEDKSRIVEGLDAGANDYITKPFHAAELRARVNVGLRMLSLQEDLHTNIKELEDAIAHIKRLEGMIPICSYCHKIRTDESDWEDFVRYITKRADVQFTHGICPSCKAEHFPKPCSSK